MNAAPVAPLALVVSSVGRADTFRRLLHSLESSTVREQLDVVLVDQSADQRCRAVVAERDWALSIRTTTSPRGASVGRNAGLALVTSPLVCFPDDDAFFPPDTCEKVLAAFAADPSMAGICGQQQTDDGRPSMLRWRPRPDFVTATNFLHTSIMSTMFFRLEWLTRVGFFDEEMGVGSPGWYGAGEESDLVLRVVEAGGRVPYDPALVVWQDEPRDVPDADFIRKMLEYGCGQGHLWRKRRLSRPLLAWYLARKVAGASVRAARGQHTLARADLAWARGNIAGLTDRCPPELRSRMAAQ